MFVAGARNSATHTSRAPDTDILFRSTSNSQYAACSRDLVWRVGRTLPGGGVMFLWVGLCGQEDFLPIASAQNAFTVLPRMQ